MNDDHIKEIVARLTCTDYARLHLGWPVYRDEARVKSETQDSNKNPGVYICKEYYFDHTKNQGGDVIELARNEMYGGNRATAIFELSKILGIEAKRDKEWLTKQEKRKQSVKQWGKQLSEKHIQHIKKRGITQETIERMGIGFNGEYITIPTERSYVRYNPELLNGKSKYLNEHQGERWFVGGVIKGKPLVISEGVFDAVSAYQEGYGAMGMLGGNLDSRWIPYIKHHDSDVILCVDTDQAGRNFEKKIIKTFLNNDIRFKVVCALDGKDLNDYLVEHGEIKTAIESAVDGIQHIVTDDLEEASHMVKQFKNKDMLDLFLLHSSEKFKPQTVRDLKSIARAKPLESVVKKEIAGKKELIFKNGLGFFEYKDGVWNPRSHFVVNSYIMKTLSFHQTNNLTNSICGLLKNECFVDVDFNDKDVFNFKNGTLDLKTGELNAHKQTDFLTMIAGYDYDPEARNKEWEKAIFEICGENKKKTELMQEMFGYCLYSDNSLNAGFFIKGGGSNGKSLIIDVLSAMLGDCNISNVELVQFGEKFDRINLISSMANILDEGTMNLRGKEHFLKAIIAGNSISGEYKGKDAVKFRPRCKIICASNEFITSRDSSHGFDRRLCLIPLEEKFAENPKNGERKADPNLTGRIMKNLSGVFTWAYEGYKRLKETNKFSKTQEQEDALQELKEINNHLIPFMREVSDGVLKDVYGIQAKQLFEHYKKWVVDNRINQRDVLNNISFGIELKKIDCGWVRDPKRYSDGVHYMREEQ